MKTTSSQSAHRATIYAKPSSHESLIPSSALPLLRAHGILVVVPVETKAVVVVVGRLFGRFFLDLGLFGRRLLDVVVGVSGNLLCDDSQWQ